jgi:hypothetical protein
VLGTFVGCMLEKYTTHTLCLVTELGFYLIDYINPHNNMCCPAENNIFIHIMSWLDILVCVCCGVSACRIIGLVFCETLNCYSYDIHSDTMF